ncbi:ATP-binding protein [bacterium]|nr:ATP-binding protein [bacterium]
MLYVLAREHLHIVSTTALEHSVDVEILEPTRKILTTEHLVQGDHGRILILVLKNLITNAQRAISRKAAAMPEELREAYLAQTRVVVRFTEDGFEVEDQGDGIAPEVAERLFERGVTEGMGQGLGMFTLRRILDKFGMHLHGESTFGQGTVFKVTLTPAVVTDISPVAQQHHARLQEIHSDVLKTMFVGETAAETGEAMDKVLAAEKAAMLLVEKVEPQVAVQQRLDDLSVDFEELQFQHQKADEIITAMQQALRRHDMQIGIERGEVQNVLADNIFWQFRTQDLTITAFKVKYVSHEEHILSIRDRKSGEVIGHANIQRYNEKSESCSLKFTVYPAHRQPERTQNVSDLLLKIIKESGLLYKQSTVREVSFIKSQDPGMAEEWDRTQAFLKKNGYNILNQNAAQFRFIEKKIGKRFDLMTNILAFTGWTALTLGYAALLLQGNGGWFAQGWLAIFSTGVLLFGTRSISGLLGAEVINLSRRFIRPGRLVVNQLLQEQISLQFDRQVDFEMLDQIDRRFAQTTSDTVYFAKWLVQDINWRSAPTRMQQIGLAALQGVNRLLRMLLLPHVLAQEQMRVAGKSDRAIYLNPFMPLYYYFAQILESFRVMAFKLRIRFSADYRKVIPEQKNIPEGISTSTKIKTLPEEFREENILHTKSGIRMNEGLLIRPSRLLQRWRLPRLMWMLILSFGFSVLDRIALVMKLRVAVNQINHENAGRFFNTMKRRYFPHNDIESQAFRPDMIVEETFLGQAGLMDVVAGKYRELPDGRVALAVYQPLLAALTSDNKQSRLMQWRQKMAFELLRHMLRYRSAQYYRTTLAQRMANQVRVGFWQWGERQPARLGRWLHRGLQMLTPTGYLNRVQAELARQHADLDRSAQLAEMLQDQTTAIARAYHTMSRNPNHRTRLHFTKTVIQWISRVNNVRQRSVELQYFSQLVRNMRAIKSAPVAEWTGLRRKLTAPNKPVLYVPVEVLSYRHTAGTLLDLLRPMPYKIREVFKKPFAPKRIRTSPAGAA